MSSSPPLSLPFSLQTSPPPLLYSSFSPFLLPNLSNPFPQILQEIILNILDQSDDRSILSISPSEHGLHCIYIWLHRSEYSNILSLRQYGMLKLGPFLSLLPSLCLWPFVWGITSLMEGGRQKEIDRQTRASATTRHITFEALLFFHSPHLLKWWCGDCLSPLRLRQEGLLSLIHLSVPESFP